MLGLGSRLGLGLMLGLELELRVRVKVRVRPSRCCTRASSGDNGLMRVFKENCDAGWCVDRGTA